ncbi:hypothetical protein ACP4OV_001923 [Aristida adscensionis]
MAGSAFRHYRQHLDGKPNTRNTNELFIKTRYPCHKQRSGSGHCGYYVMEFMNAAGTYKRHPELWPKDPFSRMDVHIDDDYLLDRVGDLCMFILDEIIHKRGRYHDPTSAIGRQANCRTLREWEHLRIGH